MAANVARLKTQLEFADAEARKTTTLKECEDELKRFRLSKELAVAKAEMEAVNVANEKKIEKDDREEDQFLPQETDRNYVLQNYLKTRDQMSSVTDASLPTVETYVESVLDRESPETRRTLIKEELWTSPFKVRSTENTNSRPVLRPDSTSNPFAPPKSTALRSSLNPLVAEFETSPYRVPRTCVDAKIPISDTARTGITADNPRASLPLNSSSVEDSLHCLADVLCQRHLQDTLPLPEPEIFGGDLLHYPLWLKSFETIIEGQTDKVSQRLYYLGKYTRGEPREAISGLLLLETADAYRRAKKILAERFGNPFLVADAYRRKINEWPKIPPNDGTSLRRFSDFLVHCQTVTKTIKYLKVLDDPDENQKMLQKLPRYLIDRWSREVDRWLNKEGEEQNRGEESVPDGDGTVYPPFKAFCRFLEREARIACNPVTTRPHKEEAPRQDAERASKSNSYRRKSAKVSTFATGSGEVKTSASDSKRENKPEAVTCPLCKGPHDLDACKSFLSMSLAERRDVIRSKALCLGCLKWGHMRKDCRRRRVCKTCNGFHPTSLHSDPAKIPEQDKAVTNATEVTNVTEVISNRAKVCGTKKTTAIRMHSLIVPVWVHHSKDAQNKLLIYALLDEQSDACFVNKDVLRKLDLNGPEVDLKISTVLAEEVVTSQKIEGLVVRGYNEEGEIPLPKTYSRSTIPAKRSQIPRPESAHGWPHLQMVSEKLMPFRSDVEVGLLIGLNCPRAIKPLEVVPGVEDDPYAKRTALGWGIIGAANPLTHEDEAETESDIFCNRIITREVQVDSSRKMCHFALRTEVKELLNPHDVAKMFTLDFNERRTEEKSLSFEDRKFLKIVRDGVHQRDDGHYKMPLPLKKEDVELPNSKELALSRLLKLKWRLTNDDQFRRDYSGFMQDIITSGYAERVPTDEPSSDNKRVWYIPHHGVYHKKKPGKIRVVFDCSAVCDGQSLNQQLLQGPDLTNNLTGVLCRFRQERVAFMCDIQAMFHQVKVDENHRDYLRFSWWDNEEFKGDPVEYRMTVHLFGATSSPGCANLALKTTADQYEEDCGTEAADFVRKDFYVDDGLKSVPTVEQAKNLIRNTKSLCQKGGFRLHKFTSNSKEVINSVPSEDQAKDTKDPRLVSNDPVIERPLGVHWCIESDTLQFRIELKDKPLSRRGILSTVSSVFDPLGLVAPFILVGKRILQELCRDGVGWDDEVPEDVRPRWEKWRSELPALEKLKIARCHKPEEFDEIKHTELHHFSDACQNGYGQCTYLQLVNAKNRIHCSLVMGKSRVTPLKPVTIPRLELTAALVSSKISYMLRKELEYEEVKETFWTDSKTVLGYINNDARQFHVFVGNRVQEIREKTLPDQWRYVGTKSNPADIASRGAGAQELINSSLWWNGPEFLWNSHEDWDPVDNIPSIPPDDPETKKITVRATQVEEPPSLLERLKYFSNWHRAKRAIAICLRLQRRFRKTSICSSQDTSPDTAERIGRAATYVPVNVQELKYSELQIIKMVQNEVFPEDIQLLKSLNVQSQVINRSTAKDGNRAMKGSSSLYKLDPFLDKDGVLRVGGRIKHSSLPYEVRHPVILPRKGHVTDMILCHHHQTIQHQGRGITQGEVRSAGYWIIGGSSAVSSHISKCVTCRRLRNMPQEQKMADLPEDRLEPAPPFTFCAVDYFGPWYIKDGRRELKRYGVLFTCLASRAIHLEVADSLSTDSFLNAYCRFVARRGPVRQLRSDQGSNFVGAMNELNQAISELGHEQIRQELLKTNCDWVDFRMNFPHSSHMGGAWERQIRTVRNVLASLLSHHGTQLDGETLRTFMAEAEAIVNCRPLTADTINSPQLPQPLTPNHLLTMKSKVIMPPPGNFQRADLYSRRRW